MRSSECYNTDTKLIIDQSVEKLKDISRLHKIPVIAISSFNRSNYKKSVGYESFKESGSIEYSSDVLLALQLADINADTKEEEVKGLWEQANKNKEDREPNHLELVCLKNRNGYTFKIDYLYLNAFNLYEEMEG